MKQDSLIVGEVAVKKSLRNVALFFILVFVQTWFFYLAIILFDLTTKEGLGLAFLICGGMAPSLIGVIMALITYNKDDKKEFFRRFYQVKRIGASWWMFVLLIVPAIHVVTVLITVISGGEMPVMDWATIQNPVSLLLALVLGFFINGAWPEEWGWRGFALQPLLNRFGFTKANFLLGAAWGVWHLPLFFISSMSHYQMGFTGFWFFMAQSIGLSFIMALAHKKTKQSILSAMLLHMFFNLGLNLMSSYAQTYESVLYSATLIAGIGIAVYMSVARKSVSSQKL
jgi:membrane protease YdiL (CAAX protease family)